MDQVETLYQLLHVDNSPKRPIWEAGSDSVARGYQSENLVDFASYYNYLLNISYPFIVMAGEFDSRDGALTQHIWMKQLLDLPIGFWNEDRRVYYIKVNGTDKVGGYW